MIDEDNDKLTPLQYSAFLEEEANRSKNMFANELETTGEDILAEIQKKKIISTVEKNNLIKKIRKKDKKYSVKELNNYSLSDVRIIYDEVKLKKSFFTKVFHFLLGFN